METLLELLKEQNTYFNPNDSLSELISKTLGGAEDELSEKDLSFVQAARGASYLKPADQRKESGHS